MKDGLGISSMQLGWMLGATAMIAIAKSKDIMLLISYYVTKHEQKKRSERV